MAIIYGTTESGGSGVLSHDELVDLIHDKSNGRAEIGNCGVCATHIENMTSTADQGGITTKYAGRTVFHISSGQRDGKDGCSVFFTLSEQSTSAKGGKTGVSFVVAGLVAVGWHAGGDTTYRLDWGKGAPFFSGNVLSSSVQKQLGKRKHAKEEHAAKNKHAKKHAKKAKKAGKKNPKPHKPTKH